MNMTSEMGWEIERWIRAKTEQLQREFPCPSCNGTGQGNDESNPYPEPCSPCWGRGFFVTEDEED